MSWRRECFFVALTMLLWPASEWAQQQKLPADGIYVAATPSLESSIPDTAAAVELPDSPDEAFSEQQGSAQPVQSKKNSSAKAQRPCEPTQPRRGLSPEAESAYLAQPHPCVPINPYRRFLDTTTPVPLSPKQKGYLAIHDVVDPFNLLTIGLNSGFTIAIDSHTAYGPGLKGFGKNVGYSFSQDATGEFVGTFAIASLAHQDPHYHRMPNASVVRRLGNAISHVAIAQGDDGHTIPNYEVLLTYPISAEISNLYVPGIAGNGPSTVKRVLIGYATEPIGNILAEFLPDFASRIHIRVIFIQNIVNQISSGQPL